jgi:hypothetical protein
MSSQPPNIDQRTYNDLVQQLSKLVFETKIEVHGAGKQWLPPDEVEIDLAGNAFASGILVGYLFNQDIQIDRTLVKKGEVLTQKLFEEIKQWKILKVKKDGTSNEQQVDLTDPNFSPDTLDKWILTQDINVNDKTISKGQVLDKSLAREIFSSRIKQIKLKPKQLKTADPGWALIRIFGRMAALVRDRLNQVPEKNFLTFLDLLGGQLNPPQPARVPLTFHLAEGSTSEGLVPKQTQVAAPPDADGATEVVFETEQDLVVTTAKLESIYVREPARDVFHKCFDIETGQQEPFPAFEGQDPIDHSLYIACNELFSLSKLTKLTLVIQTDKDSSAQNLTTIPLAQPVSGSSAQSAAVPTLKWLYWDGIQWQSLTPTDNSSSKNLWNVSFTTIPMMQACAVNKQEQRWLKARLQPVLAASPPIQTINCQAEVEFTSTPTQCFYNATSLDLNKDFYPFGEHPRVNDTFYIALPETFFDTGGEFIQPDSTIKITATLAAATYDASNLEIVWELGDGTEWRKIGNDPNDLVRWQTSPNSEAIDFTKSTSTKSPFFAETTFLLPKQLAPSTMNGQSGYWLRARITGGSYTRTSSSRTFKFYEEATLLAAEAKQNDSEITVTVDDIGSLKKGDVIRLQSDRPGEQNLKEQRTIQSVDVGDKKLTLEKLRNPYQAGTRILREVIISETTPQESNPPLLKSLTLTYQLKIKKAAIYCTYNDFTYLEPSDRIPLSPFTPTSDRVPTLYLGFSQPSALDQQHVPPFNNQPVTLYAEVEPLSPNDSLAAANAAETILQSPRLVWDYSSPAGWSPLPGVQDHTQGFFQRGLIQFIGPSDFQKASQFGRDLYWLRLRWEGGNFPIKPRLRRLLLNTTWAVQAMTLDQEVLGSSNGDRNQFFTTSQKPVLEGQRVEVQEPSPPTEEGTIEPVWVLWQEVPDFYQSQARDRHYMLDRQTGRVQFGDGQSGLVPPRGINNIRITYKTGGGVQGNKVAQTISQLKTTIPYVDRVINLEAAGGGAEQEDLEHLKERVPKQLRHRDRAVTKQDMEDLAYAVSTEVARVKVISADELTDPFQPLLSDNWLDPKTGEPTSQTSTERTQHKSSVTRGTVKVIIVPRSRDRQPIPSLALLKQVEGHLRDRAQPGVNLMVTGPRWAEVTVTAAIVPRFLEQADQVRTAVLQQLDSFLHPLTGGQGGTGWAFGRYPQRSDLYAVIQSVPGVDHVHGLKVDKMTPEKKSDESDKTLLGADVFIYSGPHQISLTLDQGGTQG